MRHWYALLVVLPTLIVGAYFYAFAADLYESEARFLVRSRAAGGAGSAAALDGGNRGPALASLLATARPAVEESRAVAAYLDSHAAVTALRREVDIVALWRRPEADVLSRLWWEEPQLEWLLWYFRRRVNIGFDPETGVMALRVQAFRPDDAQRVARQVLRMSEGLVNAFSQRTIEDSIRVALEDVAKAETRVTAAREAMIRFREAEQAFDPQGSATSAVGTIATLQGALTQARADLQERRTFMRPDNPQIQLLHNRIAALQQQINAERARVTRGEESLTQQVATYERLELERQLADRQLASATTSLEVVRSDALRQQVFVMRVADPHLPEWPRYPRASFNTLTVFISLSVLFGIGWLLVVSAREHAN